MRRDTDPPMRKGKMIAQGAHAAMSFMTRRLVTEGENKGTISVSDVEQRWMNEGFTKVCVYTKTAQHFNEIKQKAREAGLEVHEICDSGATEFRGVPTVTCMAIGPDRSSVIDPVTGELPLL